MKKTARILKWTIGIAAVVVIVIFGYKFMQGFPVYPGFLREVDTYEELQQPFTEVPAVVFTKESKESIATGEYCVLLDGSTLSAEPIGYTTYYTTRRDRARIACSHVCKLETARRLTSDAEYRDVDYLLVQSVNSEDRVDNPRNTSRLSFFLRNYEYTLSYTLYIKDLTEEEVTEMEESIKEELLQTMREIIDEYLDKSGEHS